MVPLSERRHCLYEYEIPEVVKGLRLRAHTGFFVVRVHQKKVISVRVLHFDHDQDFTEDLSD